MSAIPLGSQTPMPLLHEKKDTDTDAGLRLLQLLQALAEGLSSQTHLRTTYWRRKDHQWRSQSRKTAQETTEVQILNYVQYAFSSIESKMER